jgi:glycine cleavage system pyridoxal-binding protein P
MLEVIGVRSIDDLFDEIPRTARRRARRAARDK